MNTQFIVLAGGAGTRLWPLSRRDKPKQFIETLTGKTLLEETIARIIPLASDERDVTIVAPQNYKKHLESAKAGHRYELLLEPAANNTAAAVLRAALKYKDRNQDPVMAFLPADHMIEKPDFFRDVLGAAIQHASKTSDLCLLGCEPESPTSAYGYAFIRKSPKPPFQVLRFYEKPSSEGAQALIALGGVYWNSGVYVAKSSVIIDHFKRHAKELFDLVVQEEFHAIPSISFDRAVVEKSNSLQLFPLRCGWSDVGVLDEFLQKACKQNNVTQLSGTGASAYSKNNKKVILYGVSDLCIIETDDVILVVDTKRTTDVHALHEHINQKEPQLL